MHEGKHLVCHSLDCQGRLNRAICSSETTVTFRCASRAKAAHTHSSRVKNLALFGQASRSTQGDGDGVSEQAEQGPVSCRPRRLRAERVHSGHKGVWPMEVIALEGVVEEGRIRLKTDIRLADNTTVYVIVPGVKMERKVHLPSPHLVHREQSADFVMEIVGASPDAL